MYKQKMQDEASYANTDNNLLPVCAVIGLFKKTHYNHINSLQGV